MTSIWLAVVLPANQKPGFEIPIDKGRFQDRNYLVAQAKEHCVRVGQHILFQVS